MKKFVLPVLLSLFAAGLAQADSVTLSSDCFSPPFCRGDLTSGQYNGPLAGDTLVFDAPALAQITQDSEVSFSILWPTGGGTIQLFNSANQLLAEGTFAPGATSHFSAAYSFFYADVNFSYLNGALLGLSPLDTVGGGHISYQLYVVDDTTSSLTLDIFGSPAAATPEPATLLLLLAGAGLLFASRTLLQNR